MISYLLIAVASLQLALGFRIAARFLRNGGKDRVSHNRSPSNQNVSLIVPVLDEIARIEGFLRSCTNQTEEVIEILVVDGGSHDGTQEAVSQASCADSRIRLIDASPVPRTWTGKAWGLHVGVQRTSLESQWVLCLDADVQTRPDLTRSLVRHALRTGIDAFSAATEQQLADRVDAILHPSMLTTLIYRFGLPGGATTVASQVQANGQCFFCRRELLMRTGAIAAAQTSLCEDITIARCIASAGFAVGFYEVDDGLIRTSMYTDWRETWKNWPRSLPMRDQYFGLREGIGLAEIALVQALAVPLFVVTLLSPSSPWLIGTTGIWLLLRLGTLAGARRAYPHRPWSYWLSPLGDLPVVAKIIASALRRRHSWRGRHYLRTRGGRFRVVE